MTFSTHKQKNLVGDTVDKICIIYMFRCTDTILLRK